MKVVILRGVPGSGKSTFVKNNYPGAEVCSADLYFTDDDGEYHFVPEEIGMAHAWCLREFVSIVSQLSHPPGSVVVVDNTNITVAEFAPYAALAVAFCHELEIITLAVDPVVAIARGIHNVPKAVVWRMAGALAETRIPPWWPSRVVNNN